MMRQALDRYRSFGLVHRPQARTCRVVHLDAGVGRPLDPRAARQETLPKIGPRGPYERELPVRRALSIGVTPCGRPSRHGSRRADAPGRRVWGVRMRLDGDGHAALRRVELALGRDAADPGRCPFGHPKPGLPPRTPHTAGLSRCEPDRRTSRRTQESPGQRAVRGWWQVNLRRHEPTDLQSDRRQLVSSTRPLQR
jgi:hypothetical protein